MRRSLLAPVTLLVLAGSLAASSAAGVTIRVFQPGSLEAQLHPPIRSSTYDRLALEGVGEGESTLATPTSVPAAGSVVALQGETSSVTDYELSDSGFVFDFAHARGGVSETQAASEVDIFFSVDVETSYGFSGSYSALDPAGNDVSFAVEFLDDSTLEVLFLNSQVNSGMPDPSFLLGSLEPDGGGQLEGSLTGSLLPGRWYQLRIGASIADYFNDGPAATASGTVTLQLAPIPEPASAVLLAAGVLALAVSRRLR
jgi:hypothetical protein